MTVKEPDTSHWFSTRLAAYDADPAFVWQGRETSYGELLGEAGKWHEELARRGVAPGAGVAVVGEYSPALCALMLALIARRNVVVPLTPAVLERTGEEYLRLAGVGSVFVFDTGGDGGFRRYVARPEPARPALYDQLRAEAGLVLFSSGSTGASKAALLSADRLLEKLRGKQRRPLRALPFLQIDHIGGFNTLFSILATGGSVVAARRRDPEVVAAAIERHRVQLLPTTPSFLNMLLISGAVERYDLSSLKLITYGTEPMPESTLASLHRALPEVRLKQTYGLSELGILSTRSKDSGSLWVKVGGEGYETRVVDGILWIRARAAMLGYLNAPSPFDADGWLNTGDSVEVDGDYLRIRGRVSEIVNVGGEKVYPAEVEAVLEEMDNVREAVVRGKPNPVVGQVAAATVSLIEPEEPQALARRVRAYCQDRLPRYAVPMTVEITDRPQHGERYKKMRLPGDDVPADGSSADGGPADGGSADGGSVDGGPASGDEATD